MHVLIVDDDASIRFLYRSLLRRQRGIASLTEAATVSEALCQAAVTSPDLIVLDYELPDGTALDVLQGLQQTSSRSKILMMSGCTEPGFRESCLAAGAHDVLHKPLDMDKLRHAILCFQNLLAA